jgi:DNA-binding NarL/FixJ family response regulator
VRVIVVDDSPAVRARIVSLLGEEGGVEVVGEAWEGAQAVLLVRLHAPDVVVLDLNLPGLNGIEVLALIKAEPSPPVVVVLTNHPQSGYRDECLRSGADFFFDKSRDFDRVAGAVASARVRATPKS